MEYLQPVIDLAAEFVSANAAKLFWVVAIMAGGRSLLSLAASAIVRKADDGDGQRESGREKRAKTLADMVQAGGNVILSFVVVIMLLQMFGVDPMPILAGASVLGFAVGFGAQTLIKDFLAGIFIFAENQFAIGDRVKIGATEGLVHKMSMRSTVITDVDGNFVFIPNGTITSVINYSLGEYRAKKKKS